MILNKDNIVELKKGQVYHGIVKTSSNTYNGYFSKCSSSAVTFYFKGIDCPGLSGWTTDGNYNGENASFTGVDKGWNFMPGRESGKSFEVLGIASPGEDKTDEYISQLKSVVESQCVEITLITRHKLIKVNQNF